MWFNLNVDKLVVLLTPTFLRKPKFVALLKALVSPIGSLHQQFYVKRLENLYKLKHNGQVCYFRKALNDAFDTQLRRIRITDGNKFERQYIYTNAEAQPEFLGKVFLRQVNDYADSGVDFRVIVPIGFDLINSNYQIRALIDFYKLAGKRYLIEIDE